MKKFIVKSVRKSRKMTQHQLANALNISRTTVAMWENGSSNPTTSKLPSIANALGCQIEDLFDDDKV